MSPLAQIVLLLLVWLFVGVGTMGIGLVVLPVLYWLLVVKGGAARAAKAEQKLSGTLMKHETVVASAMQLRISALIARRQLIALTNSRIIVFTRSLFGGFTMRDYQWKDLRDAKLSENVLPHWFGSKLSFALEANVFRLHVDGIRSDVASAMYSHAQAEEQAWEEKRRVRGLEEMRAAAGGVTVHHGGVPANSNAVLEELEKAKKLYDSGAVSDAEFQEIKAKILSRAS